MKNHPQAVQGTALCEQFYETFCVIQTGTLTSLLLTLCDIDIDNIITALHLYLKAIRQFIAGPCKGVG